MCAISGHKHHHGRPSRDTVQWWEDTRALRMVMAAACVWWPDPAAVCPARSPSLPSRSYPGLCAPVPSRNVERGCITHIIAVLHCSSQRASVSADRWLIRRLVINVLGQILFQFPSSCLTQRSLPGTTPRVAARWAGHLDVKSGQAKMTLDRFDLHLVETFLRSWGTLHGIAEV